MTAILALILALQSDYPHRHSGTWTQEEVLQNVERAWRAPQVFTSETGTGLFLYQNKIMAAGTHQIRLTDGQYLQCIEALYDPILRNFKVHWVEKAPFDTDNLVGELLLRLGFHPSVAGGWIYLDAAGYRRAYTLILKDRGQKLARARDQIFQKCTLKVPAVGLLPGPQRHVVCALSATWMLNASSAPTQPAPVLYPSGRLRRSVQTGRYPIQQRHAAGESLEGRPTMYRRR